MKHPKNRKPTPANAALGASAAARPDTREPIPEIRIVRRYPMPKSRRPAVRRPIAIDRLKSAQGNAPLTAGPARPAAEGDGGGAGRHPEGGAGGEREPRAESAGDPADVVRRVHELEHGPAV